MRTVKQVSELTGISVRMLHYYDKTGLLIPSEVTSTGYRLYDDKALMTLQQILFYKELDIPLKEVKKIIYSQDYNIMQALENQKKLLILKRNRLNDLVELIDKAIKGEDVMSFKEFDMSEYYNALEDFKKEHEERIINAYGGMEQYNEFIEKLKAKETEIAEMAIKKYGSIEKYVKAMRKNYNSKALTHAEQCEEYRKDLLEDRHPVLKELYKKLVFDLSKDPASKEIRQIAGEITNTVKRDYEVFGMNKVNDYWYPMVQSYFVLPEWIEKIDEKYGNGAAKFIGEALKNYLGNYEPKLNTLYKKLTSDLNKDPHSKEIQDIVQEIADETRKSNEELQVEEGENQWGYQAELYLSNPVWKKVNDKKYGSGASEFIGEAIKYYAENMKSYV